MYIEPNMARARPIGRRLVRLIVALAILGVPSASAARDETTIRVSGRAVLVATVEAQCDACAWDVAGREAVVLRVSLAGRYVQHLPLVRSGQAQYHVLVGTVDAGDHVVSVDVDREASARDLRAAGAASARIVRVRATAESDPAYRALAHAPFLYERPGTSARFTDLPVFMWYEVEPTSRGTRYRYSVIFTNEDGGTPADRLMATWGRTTDIEYVYSVELDARGMVLADDMQGPKHEILPFAGKREGRHPLLWVSTDNNMVLDTGTTSIRYAPAPIAFPLRDVSREAVMDAHPWLYAVMARELIREGKVVPGAPPGTGAIPDPRRFVYIEACGELEGAALAFALRFEREGGTRPEPVSSDRGVTDYRIVRDGCFRAAVPLPPAVNPTDVHGFQARAYRRPVTDGETPPVGTPRVTRVNSLFVLDEEYQPLPSFFKWSGTLTLVPDGPPVELPVR